jgi:hypothetical protein
MFPTSQKCPPMAYTDPNLQNQTPWQQPEHYAPNTIQTQLPYQLPQQYQSQQLSLSQQPGSQNFSINSILKPPKLNLNTMAENNDIETDSSDYEHETNDVAKEQENSWQRVKKSTKGTQNEEPNTSTIAPTKVQNRFNLLTTVTESNTTETDGINNPPRTPKPPPIFTYGVKNVKEMIKSLSDAIGQEAYYTKTLPD